MFFLAAKLHKTVGEISEMPALEFMQWAAYEQLTSGQGQQTPDEMLAIAKRITQGATARG